MALSPRSEDVLESLVFGIGVAITDAENGRPADPAEFRNRVISLCKKWLADIESLIAATDPALHASVNLLSLRQENAALKNELEALKNENASLKAQNKALQERTLASEPKGKPPEKKQEAPEEKSEFSDAMKDVRRY